jgi:hypothetical protein
MAVYNTPYRPAGTCCVSAIVATRPRSGGLAALPNSGQLKGRQTACSCLALPPQQRASLTLICRTASALPLFHPNPPLNTLFQHKSPSHCTLTLMCRTASALPPLREVNSSGSKPA